MKKTLGIRGPAAKKVAYMGLLFALAAVFSYLENFFPALPGMPPGVKLGLSNIVTMFCIFFVGLPAAATVLLLKSGLAFLTRGAAAALLSVSGGVLSLLAMELLLRTGRGRISNGFISAAGGVCHNIGQLVATRLLLFGTGAVFYYLPVLIISGIAAGLLTGLLLKTASPYLQRALARERGE